MTVSRMTHVAKANSEELRPLLVKALSEHAMLLVWDNFESVRSMADPGSLTPPLEAAEREKIAAWRRAADRRS